MKIARDAGFPVPRVYAATGPILVMERVAGPTMLEEIAAYPAVAFERFEALAALHDQLHAIPGPDWLQQPFGAGGSMLHLDLHPGNVIVTPAGLTVIDWSNVACGPAAADLAMTWVLLSSTQAYRGMEPTRLQMLLPVAAKIFLRYVDATAVFEALPNVLEYRREAGTLLPDEPAKLERLAWQSTRRATRARWATRP